MLVIATVNDKYIVHTYLRYQKEIVIESTFKELFLNLV